MKKVLAASVFLLVLALVFAGCTNPAADPIVGDESGDDGERESSRTFVKVFADRNNFEVVGTFYYDKPLSLDRLNLQEMWEEKDVNGNIVIVYEPLEDYTSEPEEGTTIIKESDLKDGRYEVVVSHEGWGWEETFYITEGSLSRDDPEKLTITYPDKWYEPGVTKEGLDFAGLKITMAYMDPATEPKVFEISGKKDFDDNFRVETFDSSNSGFSNVTVSYKSIADLTATYPVWIRGVKELVVEAPTKTEYWDDETLIRDGFKVTAVYDEGESREITEEIWTQIMENPDYKQSLPKTINFDYMYGGKITPASFDLEVTEVVLEEIILENVDTGYKYEWGEPFNSADLNVFARYNKPGMGKVDVTDTDDTRLVITESGFDENNYGAYINTVTVKYTDEKGRTASKVLEVQVAARVPMWEGIEVDTTAAKTEFAYKELFSPEGLKVYKKFDVPGREPEEVVNFAVDFSSYYDPNQPGEYRIIVNAETGNAEEVYSAYYNVTVGDFPVVTANGEFTGYTRNWLRDDPVYASGEATIAGEYTRIRYSDNARSLDITAVGTNQVIGTVAISKPSKSGSNYFATAKITLDPELIRNHTIQYYFGTSTPNSTTRYTTNNTTTISLNSMSTKNSYYLAIKVSGELDTGTTTPVYDYDDLPPAEFNFTTSESVPAPGSLKLEAVPVVETGKVSLKVTFDGVQNPNGENEYYLTVNDTPYLIPAEFALDGYTIPEDINWTVAGENGSGTGSALISARVDQK